MRIDGPWDKVVPGYYHRRNMDGYYENSTCCNNTVGLYEHSAEILNLQVQFYLLKLVHSTFERVS